MDALETLLRPAAALVNRQIDAKTPARELSKALDGHVLAIRVPDTALAMYFIAEDGRILLSGNYGDDPDVVLSGSIISLARLAGPTGEDLIRDGTIGISGDPQLAGQFQKLLRYGRPDFEEELSGTIGDVAAHGIGEFVRGVGEWARDARTTMQQNIGEYLQEESQAVPGRYESDEFRDGVNTLRDDVARFEARLRKLEKERG